MTNDNQLVMQVAQTGKDGSQSLVPVDCLRCFLNNHKGRRAVCFPDGSPKLFFVIRNPSMLAPVFFIGVQNQGPAIGLHPILPRQLFSKGSLA
jgi:hypothetical protein